MRSKLRGASQKASTKQHKLKGKNKSTGTRRLEERNLTMHTIQINASSSYNIYIGTGILKDAGRMISDVLGSSERRVLIVTDDNAGRLYGSSLTKSLEGAGIQHTQIVLENGEKSKNLESYIRIIQTLKDMGFSRSNAVVALGGGVIGDLAGFAAATYMRGMKLVQIPTTVLAAVDSSVGGKTAVDFDDAKNLIGCFCQPDLVICDTAAFDTLPDEVMRDGCAEIAKYGILSDSLLFERISQSCAAGEAPDEEIIAECVNIKKQYVEEDEFDTGKRNFLNLGHTIGHAVESCSNYTVSHGAAVACGLRAVAQIACALGICDAECAAEITGGIKRMGFDTAIPYSAQELTDRIFHDKKRTSDSVAMILPESIGSCVKKSIRIDELGTLLGML